MAQIFYVHCPTCGGKFPCHPELWQVDYELLCPFCGDSFPQEASPLIITATGERRPGRDAGRPRPPSGAAGPARTPARAPAGDEDPSSSAESM
jgi:hypothetical protein